MIRSTTNAFTINARGLALLLCAVVYAATGMGCGGGSRPLTADARVGRLTLNVTWPARTRLIPQAANSILASLGNGGKSLGSRLLTRPAGSATTSTVTFENLPPGAAVLTAAAYPNVDGTGTAQAQGSAAVTIVAGTTANVGVTMNSTIDHLETSPAGPTVTAGQSLQLTMTAKDAAGNVVLTTPGKVTWNSASQGVAIIDGTGKATGVSVGSSVLTVTETESGKTAQTTLQVSSQAGSGLSFLYGAGSGQKVVQFKINADGTLTAVPSAAPSLPVGADTIVADPLGRFVYVTLTSGASSSDIVNQYSVGTDGSLTAIGGNTTLTTFGAISGVVDPSGHFLYLTNGASGTRERLTRFIINGDGTLSNGAFANPNVTGLLSTQAIAFDTAGRFVYLPFQGATEGILQYSVNSDGTLAPLSPVVAAVNGRPLTGLAAATDRFVYVVTLDHSGNGVVHPFQIGADGSLSAAATGSAGAGDLPASMTTDPGKHFLYVINEGDSTVSQIKINSDGTLTALSPATVATGTAPTQMVFDPTGTFAYVLCNNSVISLYRVNADGTLATLSLSTPGTTPLDGIDAIATLKH